MLLSSRSAAAAVSSLPKVNLDRDIIASQKVGTDSERVYTHDNIISSTTFHHPSSLLLPLLADPRHPPGQAAGLAPLARREPINDGAPLRLHNVEELRLGDGQRERRGSGLSIIASVLLYASNGRFCAVFVVYASTSAASDSCNRQPRQLRQLHKSQSQSDPDCDL